MSKNKFADLRMNYNFAFEIQLRGFIFSNYINKDLNGI